MNTADGASKPQDSSSIALDAHQKEVLRKAIHDLALTLMGIRYDREDSDPNTPWTGRGKWMDFSKPPVSFDCSGFTAAVVQKNGLKFPHGAQAQYNFTLKVDAPQVGDFVFSAPEKDISRIGHVGLVISNQAIIESRAFDINAPFTTGEVIIRPMVRWEAWDKFVGYRSHPRLI